MPAYDEIRDQLIELLRPHADPDVQLGDDSELVADIGLSSLKVLNLLMDIEDRFDLSVPLNVLPEIRTVRDFAVKLEELANSPEKSG